MAELKEYLDYSEYDKASPRYDIKNEKVLGKFKCETQGNPIIEFVGLRPKMYSILYKDKSATTKEKHRAKGISKSARRDLKHEEYKKQLDLPSENYITNRRLGSKLHKIYAVAIEKRGLCSFDDKRFILDDRIHTLAYGHKDITKEIVTDDIQNPGGDLIMTDREARLRGLLWSRRKGALNRREAVKAIADQKKVHDGDLDVEIQSGQEQRKSLKRKLDSVETIPAQYIEPEIEEEEASAESLDGSDETEPPTNPCAEAIDDDDIDADWPSDDDLNYEESTPQKKPRD